MKPPRKKAIPTYSRGRWKTIFRTTWATAAAMALVAGSGGTALAGTVTSDIDSATRVAGEFPYEISTAGADTLTLSGTVTTNGADIILDSTSSLDLAGYAFTIGGTSKFTGVNGLTVTSTVGGTLALAMSGINDYSGPTTVDGSATLKLNLANQISDASALFLANGGIFDMNGFNDTVASVTLTNGTINGTGSTLTSPGAITLEQGTVNVNLSGAILDKDTAGAVTLNGASDAATVNIKDGTLTLGASGDFADTAAVILGATGNPATLDFNDVSQTIGSLAGTADDIVDLGSGTLTVGDGSSTTYAGVIQGSGQLTKQGAGALTLSGANSYTGATAINVGTLEIQHNTGLGTTAAGTTVATGATLELDGSGGDLTVGAEDLTLNGAGFGGAGALHSSAGTNTLAGAVDLAADSTVNVSAGGLALSGVVSESGGARTLTKIGSGTLTLSGVNTYSGATTLSAGTLVITNSAGLGAADGTASTATNVWPNATLELDGSGGDLAVGNELLTLNGTGVGGTAGALHNVVGTNTWAGNMSMINDSSVNIDAATQLTLNGVVSSGVGIDLDKIGDGTLTLTGVNTYNGATTVTAGILEITDSAGLGAADNTAATGTTVVDGATLELDGTGGDLTVGAEALILNGAGFGGAGALLSSAGTNTLAGTMAMATSSTVNVSADSLALNGVVSDGGGALNLSKTGAGLLSLNGVNTYTGTTSVNAGRLDVNGSITSNTSVASGATLGGTGTITGTVDINGTTAPGNSIGTLIVTGDYNQNANSTYEVELDSAGNTDLIAVSGTTTISTTGTTVDVQAAGVSTDYARQTYYEIITSGGGDVVGTYAATTSSIAGLTPYLYYNADPTVTGSGSGDVWLLMHRNDFDFSAVLGAQTPNQIAVANNLSVISATVVTGEMNTILNNLTAMTPAQVLEALDQIGGQHLPTGMSTISRLSNQAYFQSVTGRLTEFHNFTSADARRNAKPIMLAAAGDITNLGLVEPGTGRQVAGLWVKGFGSLGNVEDDVNSKGYDYDIYGVAGGIEAVLGESVLLGVSVGGAKADAKFDSNSGDGDVDSLHVGLYGSFDNGPFYLDLRAGYTSNSTDISRAIVFPGTNTIAKASYDGQAWNTGITGGLRFTAENGLEFTPSLAFNWVSTDDDAYTETGAGVLNQTVGERDNDYLSSTLALRLAYPITTESGNKVTPEIRAAWNHSFDDYQESVTARLSGPGLGDNFTLVGVDLNEDSFKGGVGISAMLYPNLVLMADYDAEIRSDQIDHTVSADLKIVW